MRVTLTAIYLAATAASLLAAVVTERRRRSPAAKWLVLLILAAGAWALFDALELQLSTPDGKRFVSQLQYLAIVSVAPLFFHTAFVLSRLEERITRWVLAAVWSIPLVTLGFAWTSAWHSALWTGVTIPDPRTNLGVYEYGWWFWVFALHSYVLLL